MLTFPFSAEVECPNCDKEIEDEFRNRDEEPTCPLCGGKISIDFDEIEEEAADQAEKIFSREFRNLF